MTEPQRQYAFVTATRGGAARKERQQRAILEHWFPPLPGDAHILEIGAGRGEFARVCLAAGYRYVAVEPSDALRESLASQGIQTIGESVPPIAAESCQFDLVHSFDFVEHLIDYREVMAFLNESLRVLKPGGLISIIVPNCHTIGRLFYLYEYQHTYVTTLPRLEKMLADCGFDLLKSQSYLFRLGRRWNWADRVLANIFIPAVTNRLFEGIASSISRDFLFRVHKNAFDHIALIARKPEVEH